MTTPQTSLAPPATRADADLVARIADRDETALAALYERFAASLLAIGVRILGRSGDAEDVVQDVFLQVWRQAGRYDPERSSVAGWLSLITRSRAIDRLRNRRVGERTVADAHAESGVVDASPDGAGNVLFAERRRRITEALGGLPAEQREVIELSFFAGLTQNEIAARTRTPLGTVKTRTLLALKKLRTALRDDLEDLL